jgi:hypothetical protein
VFNVILVTLIFSVWLSNAVKDFHILISPVQCNNSVTNFMHTTVMNSNTTKMMMITMYQGNMLFSVLWTQTQPRWWWLRCIKETCFSLSYPVRWGTSLRYIRKNAAEFLSRYCGFQVRTKKMTCQFSSTMKEHSLSSPLQNQFVLGELGVALFADALPLWCRSCGCMSFTGHHKSNSTHMWSSRTNPGR